MKMKKLFILGLFLLIMAGKIHAQEEGQLIRYDKTRFEKIVNNTEVVKANPSMASWAKEVFQAYCSDKNVKVDFTESDYQAAKSKVEKLEKQLEDLQKAKDATSSRLKGDIQERDTTIAQLNRQVNKLKSQMASMNSAITNNDAVLNKLRQDAATINEKNRELQIKLMNAESEKTSLQNELNEKNSLIAALKETSDSLRSQNERLGVMMENTEALFNSTLNFIDGVYKSNSLKRIDSISAEDLDEAMSLYKNMKRLLEVDPTVTESLKNKIDEMNEWKKCVEPMRGAREYMKGKYDETKRKSWIDRINQISVVGSKAEEEKSEVLRLLENQAGLKNKYDILVQALGDNFGCLYDKAKLDAAYRDFKVLKSLADDYWTVGVYDSYDVAINRIETELTRSEPSEEVDTSSSYKEFIKDLKGAF